MGSRDLSESTSIHKSKGQSQRGATQGGSPLKSEKRQQFLFRCMEPVRTAKGRVARASENAVGIPGET